MTLREYAAAASAETPLTGNLTEDVVRAAADSPDLVQFSLRAGEQWEGVTAERFRADVISVAKGFLAAGIGMGDRIALIARTRYEWTVVDYAIWWVGAVTVPIYEASAAEQIGWLISDSGAAACVVETDEHRSRVEKVRSELPDLQHLWGLEHGLLPELTAGGAQVGDADLERRRSAVGPESLATLIYTSGTTGQPKGCMLTHGNLMTELDAAVHELRTLFAGQDASTLLFLPLAHVFARIIPAACIKAGVRLGYSADPRNLARDLQELQPTFVLAVPRVLEKVFNSASQQAHSEGRGKLFDAAAATAIGYSHALSHGRVRPWLRARHALFDQRVYASLRRALGGRTRYAISGGAPLGERLAHFYRGIGVTVLEGYGMTEGAGALTVNRPEAIKVGTVGRPLGGTAVRVADDGELLFKGGQVFAGYWRDNQATHDVLDDEGWLRSGDLGEVDDEGYVRITGRKKEILVTAGGKNVSPAGLEEAIRIHPLISNCLVVGEARPFVAALITLDPEAFERWRRRNCKKGKLSNLVADPDLMAEVQQAVDSANRTVSQAESIRRFRILPNDWTENSGHVTPTLKLKRHLVLRDFRDHVEALYR